MKKFFGFGSSTPLPPPPPSKPPSPPPIPAAALTDASSSGKTAAASTYTKVAAAAPTIVGRWKEPNSSDTTEFHADGTVTEKTSGGDTIRGRYSLREKQLKINLDGVPDELSFPVAIAADALEMTDTDGKVTHYRRVS